MTDRTQRGRNRLASETSPYLLQHADNPVDWYPWGPEPFEVARAANKLVLLSVGYSSCHWCHVMERESFANEDIAAIMNDLFICIKVDREERPDVDEVYMAATVAMNNGQGGWPMTVFLTPDREPVFAGTYFPPEDVPGRPGFPRIMRRLAELWNHEPTSLTDNAGRVVQHLKARSDTPGFQNLTREDMESGVSQFTAEFDSERGGFGPAPKFPPATAIRFLLRMSLRLDDPFAATMATSTLDAMAKGGIYDHIGGGFSRYSTDADWLVPHFEKMLYDNALLIVAYLEAFQLTGEPAYAEVAHETIAWVTREMTGEQGEIYSSQDADSEGVEGKYYVWTPAEVGAVLGDEADTFCRVFDISDAGNWEGKSIPNRQGNPAPILDDTGLSEEDLGELILKQKERLLDARAKRVAPATDDKVLTAWNGLMVSALAQASWILGKPDYLESGKRAADFVLGNMYEDGNLMRSHRAGQTQHRGQLEDYAYFVQGLLDLYEAGAGTGYWKQALALTEKMQQRFQDEDGSFFSAPESDELPVRFRDGTDGATPSANAIAAHNLARIASHTGDSKMATAAAAAVSSFGRTIAQIPRAFASSLVTLDFLLGPVTEIAIIGNVEERAKMDERLATVFLPRRIILRAAEGEDTNPLAMGKSSRGSVAAYVCQDFTCAEPSSDPDEFEREIRRRVTNPVGTGSLRMVVAGGATDQTEKSEVARRSLGKTGLFVSPIGFGGYRTGLGDPEHGAALESALRGGVNLVDTSSNYMDGESERLIGERMSELIADGNIDREKIVVATKAGYMQGRALQRAMDREARHTPYPGVVKFDDNLWHCLHPEFLADELSLSLERTGLETIDVYLLHNPEYFLAHARSEGVPPRNAWDELSSRLVSAFEYLESQVEGGRIAWYGVSSNTLTLEPSNHDDLSLAMILEAARTVGGDNNHLGAVEFPLNLLESAPATSGLVAEAESTGLGVLVNRPINAVSDGKIIRLADIRIPVEAIDVKKQLQRVAELEKEYAQLFAPGVRGTLGAEHPAGQLDLADKLESLLPQIGGLEYWSQLEPQVRHSIDSILTVADRLLRPATGPRWTEWLSSYQGEIEELLTEMRRLAATRSRDRAAAIRNELAPRLPEGREDDSLSLLALWTVVSIPGVTSVLTGMRRRPYVQDALEVLSREPLEQTEQILTALARLELPN